MKMIIIKIFVFIIIFCYTFKKSIAKYKFQNNSQIRVFAICFAPLFLKVEKVELNKSIFIAVNRKTCFMKSVLTMIFI